MNTGFYCACEETEEFGLGMNLVYSEEEDDLQLSFFFGNYVFAIGYTFGGSW